LFVSDQIMPWYDMIWYGVCVFCFRYSLFVWRQIKEKKMEC
jgi:hypothetical protein